MKVVVTGSLGNISKPLTQELVAQGHQVMVISSNPEKQAAIEELGAQAAIGSVTDIDFLTETFKGANAVYCMVPPANYHNQDVSISQYYPSIGNSYAKAILAAGVKKVIHLSSVGGNMAKNNGMLSMHHAVETIFSELPSDVIVKTMRPTSFFTNLYMLIPGIKMRGEIVSNYGENDVCPWVSPKDIASAVAEEIDSEFDSRKVRYVTSEEMSCNEIAGILGNAIGKPDLKWSIVSDEEILNGMLAIGINRERSEGVVEMNKSIHSGILFEDYKKNKPVFGKTKLTDFAADFAKAYHS